MDAISTIALTMGVAWAAGINLYAAVFMLGFLNNTGAINLPPDLIYLGDPLVLAAAGFMYCVEFFADKTPGVDSAWDALHTFIRIPAGAVLAAQAIGDVSPAAELAAVLIGGSLAATSHATKTGSRMLINTSPEPFSNWTASVAEDAAVLGGLWLALQYPLAFLVALIVFVGVAIWLLPKLWRGIKRISTTIGRWISGSPPPSPDSSGPPVPPGLPPRVDPR